MKSSPVFADFSKIKGYKQVSNPARITYIYGPHNPPPIELPENAKHYIVFELKAGDATQEQLIEYTKKRLSRLLHLTQNYLALTDDKGNQYIYIKGARKLDLAIEIFNDYPEYKTDANKDLKDQLAILQKNTREAYQDRPKTLIHQLYKKGKYEFSKEQLPPSYNQVNKLTQNQNGRELYLKQPEAQGRGHMEIGILASYFYNLMVPGITPKQELLYGLHNQRIGIVSEAVNNFTAFFDTLYSDNRAIMQAENNQPVFSKNRKLSEQEITQLIIICTVSFLGGDNDLNTRNYAIKDSLATIIDTDRALFPLVKSYFNGCYEAEHAFPINENILQSFPILDKKDYPEKSEPPYHWPMKQSIFCENKKLYLLNPLPKQVLDEHRKNPAFCQKLDFAIYKIFLKTALIPDETIKGMASALLSTEKKQKRCSDYLFNLKLSLLDCLPKTHRFTELWENESLRKKLIEAILAEFEQNNICYANDYADQEEIKDLLWVDIEKVRENFDTFSKSMTNNPQISYS